MIRLKFSKRFQQKGQEGFTLCVETEFHEGEFVTLFGKSGAGKSSILRILAGLVKPDCGEIFIGECCWFDSSKSFNLPPQKREVGMVFQDYALFPNMSVEQNLLYALKDQKVRGRMEEILELMELSPLRKESPALLSGGQQQRVALARALMHEPKLLLLDEPLSALDHTMRRKLQEEILNIHRHFGVTTLLVSHDLGEVMRLSHRVLEVGGGRILRAGMPSEIFGWGNLSGKFRFSGEILNLSSHDLIHVATVLVGHESIKVVLDEEERENLQVGDRVILSSKAFNPLILRA